MQARVEFLPEKKLVGISMEMSLAKNKTHQLWSRFMPQRDLVENRIDSNFYSLQIYDKVFDAKVFEPTTNFVKWAAVEVSEFGSNETDFETMVLPEGHYAVFLHKGLPSDFPKSFQFIFGEWLPKSDYILDDRPHFELLGSKYKNNHPDSEEEIWIPIKPKK